MSQLFDPETGELKEQGERCENCAAALAQAAEAEMRLRAVERKLTLEIGISARLRAELERQRTETPEGRKAKALGKYWIVRLGKNPKRTKVKDKRLKAVIDRLRDGYEPSYIARAIDGAAEAASTTTPETERLAFIETINHAIKRLPKQDAEELRRVYREAMKNVVRYDDLELICRDETKLERFHDLAERVGATSLVGPAWLRDFEGVELPEQSTDAPF